MSAIIKALQKALETDPSNWEARHALIEAHLAEGEKAEAHALLENIDALPEDEPSLIAAGLSYALAGSVEDGRGIVQHVLEHNPGNADAHLALASIAHQDGDGKTAMRHYLTATGINPKLSSRELDATYGGVLDGISAGASNPAAGETRSAIQEEPAAAVEEVPSEEEVIPVLTPKPLTKPEPKETKPEEAPEPGAEEEAEESAVQAVEVVEEQKEEAETREPEPVAAEEEKEEEPVAAPPAAVEKAPAEDPGPATVKLIDAGRTEGSMKIPTPTAALAEAETSAGDEEIEMAEAAVAEVPDDFVFEDDAHDEFDSEHLKLWLEEAEAERQKSIARDKIASLTVTILLHVGVFALLGMVIMHGPRDVPPQIIASAAPADTQEDVQTKTIQRTKVQPASSSASATDLVTASNFSAVSIANVESADMGMESAFAVDFQPSMSFGDASVSPNSKMMFGQKMEGEVLGVILDVSGSMAEYLPMVVREVDKNFKNAPIVYVNHAGMLGEVTDELKKVREGGLYDKSSWNILPIVAEEVMPYWEDETTRRHHSPYWFLWGDLPRKAEQHYVDRLIDTFKTRPNMFIVRGGRNRVGAAAEFLMTQGIDSLYIFSDFEDFVDEEYCTELGKRLSRKNVKTYVQPAAARTEYLAVVARRVAGRSMGRELPPLTDILRPGDMEPAPIAVAEKPKPTPVPDGVTFATPRKEITGPLVYHFHWWGGGNYKERYKDTLKVVEFPNFDVVIRGPAARAYIYLKTKEGYIQNPIVFGYHSRKPYVSEKDGKTYYRWRKWLRNVDEPKMEGDEFVWNMVLEDEIRFDVRFTFKSDKLTGTYRAEFPPNGEYDYAHIYFVVPPMARETKDRYVGLDFPGGLSLEDLRLAMTDNTATFYLPVQAQDRLGTSWSRLGFKKGENRCPFNILYRDLPEGVREVTVSGPSFDRFTLKARTTSNDLLLSTGNRADMELWEGFLCRLVRPNDRREGFRKTEAIAFSIE